MIEDAELLRRYATENNESDFGEFVRRHVDFVFACALRRVGGDAHFAEDVTQQVFVAAASDAKRLAAHPVPTGWLFTATRNIAAQLVRTERRRQHREQEALAMKENEDSNETTVAWTQLRPVIDDALDALSEDDRQAVLLRYFENKTFAEVGARLRLAENAARMRVDRALDKLNAALTQRGVSSTAAALAVGLAGQVGIAAPAGLALAATQAALAGAASASLATTSVAFMGMTKLQIAVASVMVAAGTTGFVAQYRQAQAMRGEIARLEQKVGTIAGLEAENRRLADLRQSAAVMNANAGEIERLHEEAASIRDKINSLGVGRSTAPVATEQKPALPFPSVVYSLKDVDRPPKAASQLAPIYPRGLRYAGMKGESLVEFIIDADGKVQNARIVKTTHSELGDSALESVRRWTFEPAIKGGKPVATHMQVPIVFTLSDESEEADASRPSSNQFLPWF